MAARSKPRSLFPEAIARIKRYPAVGIMGARQVGKTTLSSQLVKVLDRKVLHIDLENSDHVALLNDAQAFLWANKDKLIVIDEVQRMPTLFPLMRSLIDRDRRPERFLLLGSSSPAIIRTSAESLAGRIAYLDLFPFSVHEVSAKDLNKLWLRGGYPEAFLTPTNEEAFIWLDNYIRGFVERDMALLGLGAAPSGTRAMLAMLASVHGQPLNMAMVAKSIGMSIPTVKRYLEFFEQAFLVSVLPSYHLNLRKRLTKAPKVYITDSGLLHGFLRIKDLQTLRSGIHVGTSWEGFVIQQVRAWLGKRGELFYFRTQDGSELDLVITAGTRAIVAMEIKTTNSPALSKGNQLAFETVGAKVQLIVTPDAMDHPYGNGVQVCSLSTLWKHLEKALR
ncbi:MAG: ATP-binding protein [Flavobacteriales bacterium]|jgi:predicted AAA+ superfamily ATPase|nr:ATP-binding protein [Flavobacteriales bacterium]MBK6551742.1 ATP-binding protein [Flavobacteriales bacterium]MBK7112221.1 ATP-binding protein [Flavobacteriales bacterium]MBK7481773.1 ATP-binding protein [Flavobacteriales bacterium]MBK7618757.1 ATP-binding protein [Flavobacteriales bacterium]